MKRKVIGTLALGAALVLVVASAARASGRVWISQSGDEHDLHGEVAFVEDAEVIDLSELADGETRVFSGGEKQLTVTREGDALKLTQEAGADGKALSVVCRAGVDTCHVLTFNDDPEKVAVVVDSTRECVHGVGDCDLEVEALAGKGAHVIVRKSIDCDDAGDCEAQVVRVGGEHLKDIFVQHRGGDASLLHEGATEHDLSELLDGETRIFGHGDKQVTAVREGDRVSLTREATRDDDPLSVSCVLDKDICRVITFDDDPDRVVVLVEKTRECVGGKGDCDLAIIDLGFVPGGAHATKVIELHGDTSDSRRVRRIKVVTEDD